MAAKIDRLEIEIETQAQKASKQLDILATKLTNISRILSGIKTKNISNIVNVRTFTNRFNNISNSMSRFSARTDSANKTMRNLSSAFRMMYLNCFMLARGFRALENIVSKSMDYIETYNYYNVTLGKIANNFSGQWSKYGYESAEAYGDSFVARLNELTKKMSGFTVESDGMLSITGGQNLSLDPEQLMSYQSNIAAVTNSLNLCGETSVNTAKALTMLAADMSSLKNVDLKTVMTNFTSGLIGQSRALYKYGIDITNATLQTYAYKYSLETAVSEMTQADKMQLRLLAILDQSKVAWGDQANTINSVANQYRILKQQMTNVARVVGNLLIPVLQAVLPVVNGILIAFQKLVNFIGGAIFGGKWNSIMDGISGGYGSVDDVIGNLTDDTDDVVDGTDGIGDSLDSANDKAKKLQKTILGFDEINKLNDNSAINSGGNSGTTGDDIGGLGAGGIDLSDEIAKALAEYETIWDRALKNSENKAQAYADKICAAFDQIRKMAKPTTDAIKKLWDEGLSKLGDFAFDTLKDFWNNFLKPVGTWMLADDAGLPRFFNITNDLLNKIDWGRLRNSLAQFYTALQILAQFSWTALMDFYEGFMKPMAVWVMSSAIPQLVDIMTAFINKVDWERINAALRNFWGALAPFAQNVGQGLINFFSRLMNIGADFINTVVPSGLNGLAEALRKISPEQAQKIGAGLGAILIAIAGFKIIGSVSRILSPIATAIATLVGHPYILAAVGVGFLVAALDKFGIIDVDWKQIWNGIKNIKDKVVEFLEKIDWDTFIEALTNFATALPPIADGFAGMAVDIINSVIKAFKWLSDVLADMKPETLEAIGKGLAAIIAVKITSGLALNLLGLGGALKSIWSAVSLVKNGKSFGDLLTEAGSALKGMSGGLLSLGASAFVMQLIDDLGGILDGTREKSIDSAASFLDVGSALQELYDKGVISESQILSLNSMFGELKDGSMTFDEAFQNVIDSLEDAGVSSDEFRLALSNALENSSIETNEYTKQISDYINSGGQSFDEFKSKVAQSMAESSDSVLSTAQKIDEAKGLWVLGLNGWVQVTGEKAVEIYDGIESGLYPDNGNGYYNIGNGVMASFGDGITSGTAGLQSTITTSMIDSIRDKLPEGYTIGYDNGKFVIQQYAKGIEDAEGDITSALNNSTINKINSLLPEGNVLTYQEGKWAIEKYGSGATDGEASVTTALTGSTISQIEEILPKGATITYNEGSSAISGYADGILSKSEDVNSAIKDTLAGDENTEKELKSTFSGYAAYSAEGYENQIKQLASKTTSPAIKWWAKHGILEPFEKAIQIGSPSKTFESYANYTEQGFSNKIKSLITETAKTMKLWAENGINTPFKASLGITQKSKVFSDYGALCVKSLSISISDGIGEIENSMRGLGDAIKDTMRVSMEQLQRQTSGSFRDMCTEIEQICRQIESAVLNVPFSFSGLGYSISQSIGDLYNVGYNAAQSFANGFRAVHIPIPQLYISSWNTHTLYNGGWFQTPNFSVNWYKKGGFFDDPTIIGVGEDGSEAVVPFEHSPAMSKLAASIAKHMNDKELNTGRDLLQAQREFKDAQAARMEKVHPFNMGDVTGAFKEVIQDAMMEVYMATNIGKNEDKPYVLHAELKTEDNEVLARAVEKGRLKRDNRFSPISSY